MSFLSWWNLGDDARTVLRLASVIAAREDPPELRVDHLLWGLELWDTRSEREPAGRVRVSPLVGRVLDRAAREALHEAEWVVSVTDYVGILLEVFCEDAEVERFLSPRRPAAQMAELLWKNSPQTDPVPPGILAAAGTEHALGLLLHEPEVREWLRKWRLDPGGLADVLLARPPWEPFDPTVVNRAPLTRRHLGLSLAREETALRALGVEPRWFAEEFRSGPEPRCRPLRPEPGLLVDGWRLGTDPGRPKGFHRCSSGWIHRDLPRLDLDEGGPLVAITGRRLCRRGRILLWRGAPAEVAERRLGPGLCAVGTGVEVAAHVRGGRVAWVRCSRVPPTAG